MQGFCLHCGATEAAINAAADPANEWTLGCVVRPKPDAPEPRLRTSAVEDFDFIHERLGSLQREREHWGEA